MEVSVRVVLLVGPFFEMRGVAVKRQRGASAALQRIAIGFAFVGRGFAGWFSRVWVFERRGGPERQRGLSGIFVVLIDDRRVVVLPVWRWDGTRWWVWGANGVGPIGGVVVFV